MLADEIAIDFALVGDDGRLDHVKMRTTRHRPYSSTGVNVIECVPGARPRTGSGLASRCAVTLDALIDFGLATQFIRRPRNPTSRISEGVEGGPSQEL